MTDAKDSLIEILTNLRTAEEDIIKALNHLRDFKMSVMALFEPRFDAIEKRLSSLEKALR